MHLAPERLVDQVNHDILIGRFRTRVAEAGVIRLARAYLTSGIPLNGAIVYREPRTPQGAPLSQLLATVPLERVDKELERRGYCVVR